MLNEIEHHHREMQQRQADFKAALGRDLDSPNIVVGEVESTRIDLTEAQLGQAVREHSTDLMIDRAAEGRSEKALSLARKGYIPDFTIGYSYEKTGPGFRDYYMLTVGAKIPLYFWRKQTPAIEQAKLEMSAARSHIRAHELDSGASAEDQLVAISGVQCQHVPTGIREPDLPARTARRAAICVEGEVSAVSYSDRADLILEYGGVDPDHREVGDGVELRFAACANQFAPSETPSTELSASELTRPATSNRTPCGLHLAANRYRDAHGPSANCIRQS
jgi:hypothetical protein